jgi:hypothetical protein
MPHDEVANGEKNPREIVLQQKKNNDTMTTDHGRLLYYK